ncbi:DUF6953 family protein [Burkholderia arboris]|uniref:DUF6953 family protein n=1 Tax=Burkholderia arboris TaxID=488730 RepID=UPI003B8A5DBE
MRISKDVLKHFKRLTDGKVVWERGDRSWRVLRPGEVYRGRQKDQENAKMAKTQKRPTSVACSNCGRSLSLTQYTSDGPTDGFDKNMVHERHDGTLAGTSVQCSTCGHYTIFVRRRDVGTGNR